MSDDFTEVSSQGWGSRLMESIKGVLIGVLLFIISFPVHYWNESRAVTTARSLTEGKQSLVSVDAKKVEADYEGKFVHTTGKATTDDTVTDPMFNVSAPKVLRLVRKVEMYQWKEEQKKEKRKRLGGGEETVTTYHYEKVWSEEPINSNEFNTSSTTSHDNPPMPFRSEGFTAAKVNLGAFVLPERLVNKIHKSDALTVSTESASKAPEGFKLSEGGQGFYKGKTPSTPAIGDVRVTFAVVKPLEVSVYGQQSGDTLRAYQTKAGDALFELREGNMSGEEMIKAAEGENAMLTWILRLVGFVLMAVGLFLMARPLIVVADVVPFIGDFLSVGAGIFAMMIALPLTLITIGICWLVVRPVLGISLLAGAAVVIGGVIFLTRGKAKPKSAG